MEELISANLKHETQKISCLETDQKSFHDVNLEDLMKVSMANDSPILEK